MKFFASVLFLVAACGGSKPATTTTTTTDDNPAISALPDVPFDKLDHEQQEQFMEQVVVPTMKPIFQQHDAEEFADFGCETCHGESEGKSHEDEHKMPNPKLPKLNFADMSEYEAADVEWMKTVVKPTMAKLLREPEYSQEHPDGFGCAHCHPVAN